MTVVNSRRITAHDVLKRYADEGLPDFFEIELIDVNQRGHSGDTPLCMACIRGDLEEVDALLEGGAKTNMAGDMGYTPLHYATSRGLAAITRRLLEAGANPEIRNEFGETPSDVAEQLGHADLVDLLAGKTE